MKVFCCLGTRPELIKMAPVVQALQARSGNQSVEVVDTGQHSPAVLDPLFSFFEIAASHRLEARHDGDTLAQLNARLLDKGRQLLERHKPDAVLVQGDTSSALQLGVAAFLSGIPVGHVEAGLRSGNLRSPFPEEMNRNVLARIADWHYAPTDNSAKQLCKEQAPGQILTTGNTIVDALHWAKNKIERSQSKNIDPEILQRIQSLPDCETTLTITMHRRENWGSGISRVAGVVRELLVENKSIRCIWVLHPNPKVRDVVLEVMERLPAETRQRLCMLAPVGYPEMVWIMSRSTLLLSDSGGIQEESVSLGLPVLVTREETERQEIIDAGFGELVGTDPDRIRSAIAQWTVKSKQLTAMDNPYGKGEAALHISDHLAGVLERNAQDEK